MRIFLVYALLFTANLKAQTVLNFDKYFVESEDKWVAFHKDKDSSYLYGFIYIDEAAGLTLNYEGNFKILSTGEFIPKKIDSANFKIRLEPNNVLVAFIPESKFQELQIPVIPAWLKFYKTDTNSVAHLYRWGYIYNGWGLCAKALTYLERAQRLDAKFKGLEVELAFSYNCLNQFDKAIIVLQDVLQANPTDAYINKELIYAQLQSGQLDKAVESCKTALKVFTDTTYNAENCYNILHKFYENKDKVNFKLWLDETKKWTPVNEKMTKSIKAMEEDFDK